MSSARVFLFMAGAAVLFLTACQPIQPVTSYSPIEAAHQAASEADDLVQEGIRSLDAGQYDQATALFTRAIRLNPDSAGAYTGRGRALVSLAAGSHAEAYGNMEDDFIEELVADRENKYAFSQTGFNDPDQSVADLTEAINREPQNAGNYVGRGLAHAALGDLDQSAADFTEAIHRDPGLVWAHYYRGLAYYHLGELDRAQEDFTEAIELNPEFAAPYLYRGASFYMDFREGGSFPVLCYAINDFTEAIRLDPESALAYTGRCSSFAHFSQHVAPTLLQDLEIADITTAARLEPASSSFRTSQMHQDFLGQAISDFSEAIRLDPDEANTYLYRGTAHYNLGDAGFAVSDFCRAILRNPTLAEAYLRRGLAYYTLAGVDEAIEDLETYRRLAPDSPDLPAAEHLLAILRCHQSHRIPSRIHDQALGQTR